MLRKKSAFIKWANGTKFQVKSFFTWNKFRYKKCPRTMFTVELVDIIPSWINTVENVSFSKQEKNCCTIMGTEQKKMKLLYL